MSVMEKRLEAPAGGEFCHCSPFAPTTCTHTANAVCSDRRARRVGFVGDFSGRLRPTSSRTRGVGLCRLSKRIRGRFRHS